jgi:hypothetical protein
MQRVRTTSLPYAIAALAVGVLSVAFVLAGCAAPRAEGPAPAGGGAVPVANLGDSALARAARRETDRGALPTRPGEFVVVQPRLGGDGELYAAVRNRAAVPATGVRFVVARVDREGGIEDGPYTIDLGRRILQPDDVVLVPTRLGPYRDRQVLPYVKFEVRAAQSLAE